MNHRRWSPLFLEWVVVAGVTSARPWQGQRPVATDEPSPAHDPGCYLCPSVQRAAGARNPDYTGSFAFDNDFSSFGSSDVPLSEGFAQTAGVGGICRVLCWSEQHNQTLATLDEPAFEQVVELLCAEYQTLSQRDDVAYVMMFENKGKEVGVSNLHPHGQIYATEYLPQRVQTLDRALREGQLADKTLWQQLLEDPHWRGNIIEENEHFVHLLPWSARMPFETMIVPKRAIPAQSQMTATERKAYSQIWASALKRYDRFFGRSTPMISIHYNAPCDGRDLAHWHWFTLMQPPLRDAHTLKYLAGFETGGGDVVNPTLPEAAAQSLRETQP
ncbi:MAG: galactose-1-phosphate uridylyltransferase [Gammaproteobacteria bacterium]|nr:galactose-1-phosphate uridylyltransferase [Gammaproteobacteria bacterium]